MYSIFFLYFKNKFIKLVYMHRDFLGGQGGILPPENGFTP